MKRALPLFGLALLLTGCGADRPVTQTPPHAYSPPPPPAMTPSVDAAPAADPLTASDSTSTSDPLIGGAGGPTGDPLAGDDSLKGSKLLPQRSQPLSGQDLDANDGILMMNGQKMPTQHTHWLRGRVQDARVQVLLNGVRLGEFSGLVDRDITPRLRPGTNTATFTYQPNSSQSSAQIDVVEGEYHPPLPPLATFDSALSSNLSAIAMPKPQTQTFTFTAR